MRKKRSNIRTQGFTLVEVAIVVLIIGLVIGSIFAGMSVLKTSKIMSSYGRSEIYARAMEEFIHKYNALPGDMTSAQTRLTGCSGACTGGNGNAVIGPTNRDIFYGAAPTGEEAENTLFWYHLQAAALIHDIDPSAPLSDTTWGASHPAAPAGGGYVVRSMNGQFTGLNGQPVKGIFLRWQDGSPYQSANNTSGFVVTAKDAARIDAKYDDNNPLAGKVRAQGSAVAGAAADECRASPTSYATTHATATCYMYFKIRDAAGL